METIIRIRLDDKLTLPIAYHHILQSVYFKLMSDGERGTELHDKGYGYGSREYKLFTFGLIEGKYSIDRGHITFEDNITLRYRSVDEELCKRVGENALENGIDMIGNQLTDIEVEYKNISINTDSIIIKMCSPICVYETENNSKYTHYFNPYDFMFYKYVEDNFQRKYRATYGEINEYDIELLKVDVKPRDKYITRYKGIIIEAYSGTYMLRGNPRDLELLYNVGLGSKNSQGFGMFDIVENQAFQGNYLEK